MDGWQVGYGLVIGAGGQNVDAEVGGGECGFLRNQETASPETEIDHKTQVRFRVFAVVDDFNGRETSFMPSEHEALDPLVPSTILLPGHEALDSVSFFVEVCVWGREGGAF